jgi:hypothetical protein
LHFFKPVDLHDQLPHFTLQSFLLLLLDLLLLGRTAAPLEHPGRGLQHLGFLLRHLHRVQVMVRRNLLHSFDSPDGLQRYPRFELRAVVSSLLFHVSVPLGYTPETSPKLTISLAPFQRATSKTSSPSTWAKAR